MSIHTQDDSIRKSLRLQNQNPTFLNEKLSNLSSTKVRQLLQNDLHNTHTFEKNNSDMHIANNSETMNFSHIRSPNPVPSTLQDITDSNEAQAAFPTRIAAPHSDLSYLNQVRTSDHVHINANSSGPSGHDMQQQADEVKHDRRMRSGSAAEIFANNKGISQRNRNFASSGKHNFMSKHKNNAIQSDSDDEEDRMSRLSLVQRVKLHMKADKHNDKNSFSRYPTRHDKDIQPFDNISNGSMSSGHSVKAPSHLATDSHGVRTWHRWTKEKLQKVWLKLAPTFRLCAIDDANLDVTFETWKDEMKRSLHEHCWALAVTATELYPDVTERKQIRNQLIGEDGFPLYYGQDALTAVIKCIRRLRRKVYNDALEWDKYHDRPQQPEESVTAFLTRVSLSAQRIFNNTTEVFLSLNSYAFLLSIDRRLHTDIFTRCVAELDYVKKCARKYTPFMLFSHSNSTDNVDSYFTEYKMILQQAEAEVDRIKQANLRTIRPNTPAQSATTAQSAPFAQSGKMCLTCQIAPAAARGKYCSPCFRANKQPTTTASAPTALPASPIYATPAVSTNPPVTPAQQSYPQRERVERQCNKCAKMFPTHPGSRFQTCKRCYDSAAGSPPEPLQQVANKPFVNKANFSTSNVIGASSPLNVNSFSVFVTPDLCATDLLTTHSTNCVSDNMHHHVYTVLNMPAQDDMTNYPASVLSSNKTSFMNTPVVSGVSSPKTSDVFSHAVLCDVPFFIANRFCSATDIMDLNSTAFDPNHVHFPQYPDLTDGQLLHMEDSVWAGLSEDIQAVITPRYHQLESLVAAAAQPVIPLAPPVPQSHSARYSRQQANCNSCGHLRHTNTLVGNTCATCRTTLGALFTKGNSTFNRLLYQLVIDQSSASVMHDTLLTAQIVVTPAHLVDARTFLVNLQARLPVILSDLDSFYEHINDEGLAETLRDTAHTEAVNMMKRKLKALSSSSSSDPSVIVQLFSPICMPIRINMPAAHVVKGQTSSTAATACTANVNCDTLPVGQIVTPPQFNLSTSEQRELHVPMLFKEHRKLVTTCVSLYGVKVIAVIDTGSQISFLNTKIYNSIVQLQGTHDRSLVLRTAKLSTLHVAGHTMKRSVWTVIPVLHGNFHTHVEFDVNEIIPFPALLGLNCLQELNIVFSPGILHCDWSVSDNIFHDASVKHGSSANHDDDFSDPKEDPFFDECHLSARFITPSQAIDIPQSYLDEFHAIIKVEHDLNDSKHKNKDILINHPRVNGDNGLRITTPPNQYKFVKQYPVNTYNAQLARESVYASYHHGIMRPLTVADGSQWNHPLLVRPKKGPDGQWTAVRLCSDLRHLNALILDPIADNAPDVEDIFRRIGHFEVATQLDCAQSFHQFPVHPADQHKLAFTLPGSNERFTYIGAPFGLKHISSAFQALMEAMISELPQHIRITIFIDDLTVLSSTFATHAADVLAVLQLLNKYNVKLNLKKCRWCVTEFPLLGHIVSSTIRRADLRKLEGIINFPVISTNPAKATGGDVRRYLGLVAFFRAYFPSFSQIAAPLFALVGNKKALGDKWTVDAQTAFDTINHGFLSGLTPVLRDPDPKLPLHVATDASNSGVGGILYQDNGNGTKRFIAFASKALGILRSRHNTTHRELLGITTCLKAFRHWCWGRKFTLHTDHMALTYMFSQHRPADVISRYREIIADYNFDIVFCSGNLHILPDNFSRIYTHAMNTYLTRTASTDPVYHFMIHQIAREEVLLDESLDHTLSPLQPRPVVSDQPPIASSQVVPIATAADLHDSDDTSSVDTMGTTYEIFQDGNLTRFTQQQLTDMVEQYHVKFGHQGTGQILRQFQHDNIRWPNMSKHVHMILQRCVDCQRMQITKRTFRPLQHIDAVHPFDHIAIDLAEFIPTARSNKYILLLVDVATKFSILHVLPNKTAFSVAQALLHTFSLFGFPLVLQSDNGTEFSNSILASIRDAMGFQQRFTSPHHPQANGISERQIKTMKAMFHRIVGPDMLNWDLFLPQAQLAMNRRIHRAHNSVPFELMFARVHNADADYASVKPLAPLTIQDYLNRDHFMNTLVYPAIKLRTDVYHSAMSREFAHNNTLVAANFNLAVSDIVFLLPEDNSLGTAVCQGPFTVAEVLPGHNYKIRNTLTAHTHDRVHISRLKVTSHVHPFGSDIDITTPRDAACQVDAILDYRHNANGPEYFVRWTDDQSTDWLLASDIHSSDLIREFWNLHPDRNPHERDVSSIENTDASPYVATESDLYDDTDFSLSDDAPDSPSPHRVAYSASVPRTPVALRQTHVPVTDPTEILRASTARWDYGDNAIPPAANIISTPRKKKAPIRFVPT